MLFFQFGFGFGGWGEVIKTFLKFHFQGFILSATSQVKMETKPKSLISTLVLLLKSCSLPLPHTQFVPHLINAHDDLLTWMSLVHSTNT